jgi:Gamma-aminobutyrate permease and related permeases
LGGFKPLPVFHSVGSFFPNGIKGIFASMIMVMFSFTGTGIIGLAIADSENPEKDAPPAIRTITSTVIGLYTISIFIIIILMPWNVLSGYQSPFVEILKRAGVPFGSDILNFIVLTASLSGLNSSMYSASRMLNSLSLGKQGPRIFLVKNKNGVPVYALAISSIVLLLTAVLSYIIPSKVFEILAAASGFTALVNWFTISVTHFFYRRKTLREKPEKLKYKVPGWPLINVIAVTLIIVVFATSPLYPGQISGLIGSIIIFVSLVILFFILKAKKLVN